MSTPEERLQRSIAEFYAMVDSMNFTGTSQVVEVQQLKVLITRYPDQARFYLARLNQETARTDATAESRKYGRR
jgi:hypothetical protein